MYKIVSITFSIFLSSLAVADSRTDAIEDCQKYCKKNWSSSFIITNKCDAFCNKFIETSPDCIKNAIAQDNFSADCHKEPPPGMTPDECIQLNIWMNAVANCILSSKEKIEKFLDFMTPSAQEKIKKNFGPS